MNDERESIIWGTKGAPSISVYITLSTASQLRDWNRLIGDSEDISDPAIAVSV